MTTKDTGGPAFPPMHDPNTHEFGMTLRDYFAAKAMQAYLSGHISHHGHENYWHPSDIAGDAYGVADAMLAERNKQ